MALEILIGDIETAPTWCSGFLNEAHPCFSRDTPRFVAIARYTSADYILPAMLATSMTGHDMVKGEFASPPLTILANMFVTVEYLRAAQLPLGIRAFHQVSQTDYRGEKENMIGGSKQSGAILYYLRFVPID